MNLDGEGTTSLAERVRDSLEGDFFDSCHLTIQEVAPFCQSQIEMLFGAALLIAMRMAPANEPIIKLKSPGDEGETSVFLLMPQYPWRSYRIDWVIKPRLQPHAKHPYVFIECDGHAFHERTKEQAEHDRARDREIQVAGIPILRFTGRELYRNAGACALQAIKLSILPEAT